ncbi:unnamed protein product, partial [Anisakis simplex]|uniref:UDP-glucuronosyltransferase n=1 Tax=Anisakis simplex TaxID=6269 RepID=A0A0M3JAU1_ANISI
SNEIVNIGAHCSPSKALSDDIEEFVSDPKSKGTIYIAFGTNVKWAYAPSYVIQAFKEAMLKLKEYRIIFVDDVKEMFVDLAPHIKIMKWAPQYDILRDNRTVLFIGHGGLKSLKETICGKTPTLLIPIFNEQAHNTAVAAKLGK